MRLICLAVALLQCFYFIYVESFVNVVGPTNIPRLLDQHGDVFRRLRSLSTPSRLSTITSPNAEGVEVLGNERPEAETKEWRWKGHSIRYKTAGLESEGPAIIMIHGFGGNADHFRKNMGLGEVGPCYAIDLLGYGYSDKPDPGPWEERNKIYNFINWSDQIRDFVKEVVQKKDVFLVCNSVGGVAGLQAAVDDAKDNGTDSVVKGVVILNISLRGLHISKQPVLLRPLISGLQYVLRETPLGASFFGSVAKAETVKNILQQCYGDPAAVTDELVDVILKPGLREGAVKVFLDFISYSTGPLPEDLLPQLKIPVVFGWGEKDPWEPILLGKAYADFDCVEDFITIPGVGHCPQDEAPLLVNEIIRNFVLKHAAPATAAQ